MIVRKNYADYKKDNVVVVEKSDEMDFTKDEKMAILTGFLFGVLFTVILVTCISITKILTSI